MKRAFVLATAVVLIVLVTCFIDSTTSSQPTTKQEKSASIDTEKTVCSSLASETESILEAGQKGSTEDWATENGAFSGEVASNNLEADKSSDAAIQQSGNVSNPLNMMDIPADAPIPDGRVFLRGEAPYGYLPTSYPEKNVTLPIILLEPIG